VNQTESGIPATQIQRLGIPDGRRWFSVERGQLTQGLVGTVLVAVDHVLGQDSFHMATTEDQHPAEALRSLTRLSGQVG